MNEDEYEVEPDDEKDASRLEEHLELERQDGGNNKVQISFDMTSGFSRLLLPDMENYVASVFAPIQEQIRSAIPDYSEIVRKPIFLVNEDLKKQMASIGASIPATDVPVFKEILEQISEKQAQAIEGRWKSLGPLFDPAELRGLNRALLPPNLQEHANEISASQVHEFVEQEGIPLYLVPRGRTALRLLGAKDRAERRRLLGACY